MNVFIFSAGADTGGQAERTARAFHRLAPDWRVNAMVTAENYIGYPQDTPWDIDDARRLYAEADVVHHMNYLFGYAMFDRDLRKPSVVHHHGDPLRSEPDAVNREAQSVGATQVVATVDLLVEAPHASWLPGFYDIDWLRREYPHQPRKSGTVLIGHAPTVREVKGTNIIIDAIRNLSSQGYDLDFDLIEGVSWTEAMFRRARCDIWIDQIVLGYGGSAIEAMAIGVPVIAGWDDAHDLGLFYEQTHEELPFLHADAANLDARLRLLLESREECERLADAGLAFVRQWHSEETGVEQLKDIYASARPSLGVEALDLYGPVEKHKVIRRWAEPMNAKAKAKART